MRQTIIPVVTVLSALFNLDGAGVCSVHSFQLPSSTTASFLSKYKNQHVTPHWQASTIGHNCDHCTISQRQLSYAASSSSSTLLQSRKGNDSTNNNSSKEDDDSSKRKRFRAFLKKNKSPVKLVKRLRATLIASIARFKTLSKAGKTVVMLQLVSLSLILGLGTKRIIDVRTMASSQSPTSIVRQRPTEVSYSTFMDLMESSGKGHSVGNNPAIKVDSVVIGRERIGFHLKQDEELHQKALEDKKMVAKDDVSMKEVVPRNLFATKVSASPDLLSYLRENQIPFRAASTKGISTASTVARSAMFLVYFAFLFRMYKGMTGGGGANGDTPGKLARSGGKRGAKNDEPDIQFNDIEGIDSAKFEVMELVDALRNPGKYDILGARAPRGLLLEGPPGTGKTMLARACAATAGVPLLYCSGSDFVEMYVGRGAARVRKTFARAAKLAPCIIFIDELDALGKSRSGDGFGGMNFRSNDEAEQTLNQLLACMDGLDSTKSVCVLAATNRREVLDQALIRPGRFDRIIKVTLPDVQGRERILRVHANKITGFKEGQGVDEKRIGSLGKGRFVDLSALASITPGLSGAELEFIANEAAIRAVRRVSAKLREDGVDLTKVSPSVEAIDFEQSLKSFYETRKPNGDGVNDLLRNLMKPKMA